MSLQGSSHFAHASGHNLGLDHGGLASGLTSGQMEYGDKSGFMVRFLNSI